MSQILKVVESRNEVQAILYTNLRISEGDNLEVKRQKRAIQVSVSRYLKSKRRCMEALIQNNFTRQDYYCTLTFTEERLPPEKVKADARFAYFLRLLREPRYTLLKGAGAQAWGRSVPLPCGAAWGGRDRSGHPGGVGEHLWPCGGVPAPALGCAGVGQVSLEGSP